MDFTTRFDQIEAACWFTGMGADFQVLVLKCSFQSRILSLEWSRQLERIEAGVLVGLYLFKLYLDDVHVLE